MPYYCTVPRCTSMAGKAKNVSFHQFPRDEELAKLWNEILKRGKPYTKYSKVCSLHFRAEDYTITSVGKNKGQWRTLRKDAIPSQNLPSESPAPNTKSRSSSWVPNNVPSLMDPRMQQQMAQAIYVQTMLAMQASSNGSQTTHETKPPAAQSSTLTISDLEQLIIQQTYQQTDRKDIQENMNQEKTYKCVDCLKCFKDPDVFLLHRRTHKQNDLVVNEKENLNGNRSKQETLKANPILANLLKSGLTNEIPTSNGIFDTNNILSIENQIMAALAANMESYIRNLSTMLSNQAMESPSGQNSDQDHNSTDDHSEEYSEGHHVDQEGHSDHGHHSDQGHHIDQGFNIDQDIHNIDQEGDHIDQEAHNIDQESPQCDQDINNRGIKDPNCDKEDLNGSKDSNRLVIDENV